MRLRPLTIAISSAAALSAPAVLAAGYDTPILYSAQHMGMGGAAIGYVDDPSAMFHNPAGLARSMGLSLMLNATLITGEIRSAPEASLGDLTSEPIVAVAPLVGASLRVNDWIAFGAAFYPVASAGAEYRYEKNGKDVLNTTSLRFLEFAPSVAFSLPGNVQLGASWRIIMASLVREKTGEFDVDMSGVNLGGVRLGAQWSPIPALDLGLVFRNRTQTTIEDPAGFVLFPPEREVTTAFVLPAKLGFGARLNLEPVRVALDLEYAFQSQNQRSVFETNPEVPFLTINNVFRWKDTITVRGGVEYEFDGGYFVRGGAIYDSQASREMYPSAFGTPPTSTLALTGGFGMKFADRGKLNVAVAHRFGQTEVVRGGPEETCVACSFDGDYKLSMTGFYLDFMWSFDVDHKPVAEEPVTEQPASQQPPAEQPVPAEQPTAEQPTTEQPATEQPAPTTP
jgi:long-subunit fatty acid transport protein